MFSQDDDGQHGLVLVFGLIAFLLALVIGVSLYHRSSFVQPVASAAGAPAATAAPAPAFVPAPAPADSDAGAAQAASDSASVRVEQGMVKFYFASGKADLAAGASEALVGVVKSANAGRTLVISGFHDATGDAAKNANLAKQRALAVRDALKAAGVAESRIELKKPEQLAGTGSNAEARRVEISTQ